MRYLLSAFSSVVSQCPFRLSDSVFYASFFLSSHIKILKRLNVAATENKTRTTWRFTLWKICQSIVAKQSTVDTFKYARNEYFLSQIFKRKYTYTQWRSLNFQPRCLLCVWIFKTKNIAHAHIQTLTYNYRLIECKVTSFPKLTRTLTVQFGFKGEFMFFECKWLHATSEPKKRKSQHWILFWFNTNCVGIAHTTYQDCLNVIILIMIIIIWIHL